MEGQIYETIRTQVTNSTMNPSRVHDGQGNKRHDPDSHQEVTDGKVCDQHRVHRVQGFGCSHNNDDENIPYKHTSRGWSLILVTIRAWNESAAAHPSLHPNTWAPRLSPGAAWRSQTAGLLPRWSWMFLFVDESWAATWMQTNRPFLTRFPAFLHMMSPDLKSLKKCFDWSTVWFLFPSSHSNLTTSRWSDCLRAEAGRRTLVNPFTTAVCSAYKDTEPVL